jgi:hypothetical protein
MPTMANKPQAAVRKWTVEQKVRVLAEASKLNGEELTAYLRRFNDQFGASWPSGPGP